MTSPHVDRLFDSTRRLPLSWRVAIVFASVTLVWLLIDALVDAGLGPDYDRLTHTIRAALISLMVIPLIVFARRVLDKRSWAGLGLPSLKVGWRPLLIGVACWLIPAALGLIILLISGGTEIRIKTSVGEMLLTATLLVGLVFIYEALPEELIFRGYFYRNLASALPLWGAVLGQALLFVGWGLFNGGGTSLDRSLLFFVFSIVLGIIRAISGTIWTTIGFHLAFQTVAQLVGDVGDQVSISDIPAFSTLVFGLPFGLSIFFLRRFYKNRLNWRASEPD